MKLDRFLFRHGALPFGVFAVLALVAFWPRYYGTLLAERAANVHWHGVVMTLWCVALVVQPLLIRLKKRDVHRAVGRASYVLAPLIVLTGLNMTHALLGRGEPGSPGFGFDLALMVNSLVAFSVLYGLGVAYRHTPVVHARFMVASAFPLFTPITDRIIGNHLRGVIGWLPVVDGGPAVPVAGFLLALALLVGLVVWDWLAHRRRDVFLGALLLLVAYHASVLTFWRFDAWHTFGAWFLSLPLS